MPKSDEWFEKKSKEFEKKFLKSGLQEDFAPMIADIALFKSQLLNLKGKSNRAEREQVTAEELIRTAGDLKNVQEYENTFIEYLQLLRTNELASLLQERDARKKPKEQSFEKLEKILHDVYGNELNALSAQKLSRNGQNEFLGELFAFTAAQRAENLTNAIVFRNRSDQNMQNKDSQNIQLLGAMHLAELARMNFAETYRSRFAPDASTALKEASIAALGGKIVAPEVAVQGLDAISAYQTKPITDIARTQLAETLKPILTSVRTLLENNNTYKWITSHTTPPLCSHADRVVSGADPLLALCQSDPQLGAMIFQSEEDRYNFQRDAAFIKGTVFNERAKIFENIYAISQTDSMLSYGICYGNEEAAAANQDSPYLSGTPVQHRILQKIIPGQIEPSSSMAKAEFAARSAMYARIQTVAKQHRGVFQTAALGKESYAEFCTAYAAEIPYVAREEQPLVAREEQPLAASEKQPLAAREEQPLVAREEQPLAAREEQPLAASEKQPLAASEKQPLAASEEQPLAAREEQPLPASKREQEKDIRGQGKERFAEIQKMYGGSTMRGSRR